MSEENKNLSAEQAGIEPEPPEEFIDNSSSFMEEPGGENVPAPEQPLNDEPLNDLNDNMEVHHHTHPAHGKKNWKAYFWEFLMLFLAVFAGFLAENQREHYIEKLRAKQYAKSLIYDLKNDTVMVNRIIGQMKARTRDTDSLFKFLNNRPIGQIRNIDLFLLTVTDELYQPYTWNRATLEQIKNSGSLRYFSNDTIIHRITVYDAFTHHMDEDLNGDEEHFNRADEKRNQIVDLNYPQEIISALRTKTTRDSLMKTDFINEMDSKGLRLLTNSINDIKKYMNEKITLRKYLESRGERELPRLKKQAEELIILLKEEYHLK